MSVLSAAFRRSRRAASRPALRPQLFECPEIARVRLNRRQVVDDCDRRDLSTDERRRPPPGGQPYALDRVPVGGPSVVLKHRETREDHVFDVPADRVPAAQRRQPRTAEPQFVLGRSRDRGLVLVRAQFAHDGSGRPGSEGFRDNHRVEGNGRQPGRRRLLRHRRRTWAR